MGQSTESFSDISPLAVDQSNAMSQELKVLSERPAPVASATPTEQVQSTPTPSQTLDQRAADQNKSNLPGGAISNDRAAKPKEESHLGWLANDVLDISLAGAAIFGAEAIGAVVFRNPKLGAMAVETATGTAKVGLAAESASFGSKFAFLTADKVLKSTAIVGGTYGSAIVARHYGYEALTGQEESWKSSVGEFGKGLILATLTRKAVSLSDKIWPAT
ncbi:MAG: hypothetical protein JST89_18035 [Cyanobacteria bacterium SZAS-4]|nr:hypothetical protein [Cyanobacteria bacterium SZAS-4]